MKAFHVILFGIVSFLLFLTLFTLVGCQPMHPSAAGVIAPTGTDVDKASAYIGSAEDAVQQAVHHSDLAGQAVLGLASNAHKSATASLMTAKTDLATVQQRLQAQDAAIVRVTNTLNVVTHSWGYELQGIVEKLSVLLFILLSLHIVAGVVSLLAPEPIVKTVAALIAKIVNPFGWFTWAIQKFAVIETAGVAKL